MNIDHVKNTKDIVSQYMYKFINLGDICLDATIGNGNDISKIAKLIGDSGKVYGFDIQNLAIENTKKLLISEKVINRAEIINDSHENIDRYVKTKLDFIIYNLGYLPKGDKNIITNVKSTIKSINKALELMDINSIMLITTYIGHLGGKDEDYAVNQLLSSLDQKAFNVLQNDFINQKNNPPKIYIVEKL